MDQLVVFLNDRGASFCRYAAAMLAQTGALIAVLALVDLLIRKRVRASFRYWMWMLVFVKLLLPPTLALPTGVGYWLDVEAPVVAPVVEKPSPVVVSSPAAGASVSLAPGEPLGVLSVPDVSPQAAAPTVAGPALAWQAVAFVLWLVGIVVFGLLLAQRAFFVKGLIAQSEPADEGLRETLERCAQQIGVRRKVGLRVSPNTFSPAVCGLLGPTILIPASLLEKLSGANLRAVLIHELAHIKRGDLWINFIQTLLHVLYFYNPLVWLAHAMVRRVRERAVDEMVLVALGAEATSYSRTLIDIAEMAFFRASLALRLIGVAESKKSLEGRIKHMLTRPMPRSAKVGVAGIAAILTTAAALLPMARAQDREIRDASFVARLPSGVTVELLGVCNWPDGGRQCWRPDGTDLAKELYATKWNTLSTPGKYGFMMRITGPPELNISWRDIEGTTGWEGSCEVEDAQGTKLDDCTAAISDMEAGKGSTSIRIGVAGGVWSTASIHDGRRMNSRAGVLWSQAFEDSDGTQIVASTEWRKDRAERIVAVDLEGVVHTGWCGSVASGNVDQYTARFKDLRISQLKEFRFQVRPYSWAQFNNISLQPGRKTTVTIGMEASDATPPERLQRLGTRSEAAERRVAIEQLKHLALAAILYANDNEGRFAADLEALKPYVQEEARYAWMLANAEYLGQSVSLADVASNAATRPLAYWKTRPTSSDDAAVAFFDGHVESVSRDALERLDMVQAVAAQVDHTDSRFSTYEVNRSVADFAPGEDFSRPEAAYATINRMDRDDPSAWKKVSVARLAARFSQDGSRRASAPDPEWAQVLAHARIREVLVWNMTRAAVIAELPQDLAGKKIIDPFDVRFLQLENGRWLNTGNGRFASIEAAKTHFMNWMQRETTSGDAMRDPLQHAAEIKAAAAQLFEKLRTADYAAILSHYHDGRWDSDGWKEFPTLGSYMVHTDYPSFALWCCTHLKDNPIVEVQLGEVFLGDALVLDKTGWPTVPYRLTLRDGTTLAGNLPFNYSTGQGEGHWHGMEGLDWHLWPQETK